MDREEVYVLTEQIGYEHLEVVGVFRSLEMAKEEVPDVTFSGEHNGQWYAPGWDYSYEIHRVTLYNE